MYLENGILKGRCTCFNATRRQETQNKQLERRAESIIGCLGRVFPAMGRLGLSLFGLERRNFELWRQRRTMPTMGDLARRRRVG